MKRGFRPLHILLPLLVSRYSNACVTHIPRICSYRTLEPFLLFFFYSISLQHPHLSFAAWDTRFRKFALRLKLSITFSVTIPSPYCNAMPTPSATFFRCTYQMYVTRKSHNEYTISISPAVYTTCMFSEFMWIVIVIVYWTLNTSKTCVTYTLCWTQMPPV